MFIEVMYHTDIDTDRYSRGTQRRHENQAATEQFQMLVQKDVLTLLYKKYYFKLFCLRNTLAVKITGETTKLNAKGIMVIQTVVTSYSTNLHIQHQCAWELHLK